MNSEPRQYKDVDGNPVTLEWLVRNDPEWAANQIRHRDKIEAELHAANQAASDNADWFDALVRDVSAIMKCEAKPTAIIESAKFHAECVWLLKTVGEKYPVTDAADSVLAKIATESANAKSSESAGQKTES